MANYKVFKVQYMDTLRRFSTEVDENYELVLDMDGLRAKIFSFFGFSPDADITLTYIDEDGDKVTLVDDDDLRDVTKQELDFVMIDVVLNSDKVDKFSTKSSERRTPLRSMFPIRSRGWRAPLRPRQGLPPLPDLNSGIPAAAAELLESLSDQPLEGFFKLALDSVSKAASLSPLFVELVGFVSEMMKNPAGSRSKSRDSERSNTSKDENTPEELLKNATTSKGSNTSKDENMPEELLKNATTSKESNTPKDGHMLKELLKCATSMVDEIGLKELPKNATSKGSNASKGETIPKELLNCAASMLFNAESLESLSDQPLEGLSKLALDSVSKAASLSPLFVELVGFVSEMMKNPAGSRSQSRDSGRSNTSKDENTPEELLKNATTSKGSYTSKDENMPEELLKNATTSKESNTPKDGHMLKELLKCATSMVNEIGPKELPKNATSKGSNASKGETIPNELLNCAASMLFNALEDESLLDGLLTCATSIASNVPKEKSCLKSLEKNATPSMSNASKDKSKPEEFLKDVSSEGSNASKYGGSQKLVPKSTTGSKSKQEVVDLNKDIFGGLGTTATTPYELFSEDVGTTVTYVTTAPAHLNYNAASGSQPLHKKSAPPLVSPFDAPAITPPAHKNSSPAVSTFGAPPPTSPPTHKKSPPAVSIFGVPPPPKPQPVVKIQNTNPFVYSSLSSFVPPNKSASEGGSTLPASSSSSVPAVSSSSSAPCPIVPPPLPRPQPGALRSAYIPSSGPYYAAPYGSAFGVSRSSAFAPYGASSSHHVPPKEGQ